MVNGNNKDFLDANPEVANFFTTEANTSAPAADGTDASANILDDGDILSMITEFENSVNEDTQNLRNIMDSDSPDMTEEIVRKMTHQPGELAAADIDITSIVGDADASEFLTEANKQAIESNIKSKVSGMDLSDEDAALMMELVRAKRAGKPILFKDAPENIKSIVRKMAMENKMDPSSFNLITDFLIGEFINDSEIEELFIDFEQSISKALNIPNMMDLYSESIKETMTEKLPKLADEIREQDPEKAANIDAIVESFKDTYTLDRMRNVFYSNSKARKDMRRYSTEYKLYKRMLDDFNFSNEDSIFRMSDVNTMIDGLEKILITEPADIIMAAEADGIEADPSVKVYATSDVGKFMILWCKSCEMLDTNSVVDASYLYYGMKNIAVLAYTEEAKTDFAAELISNVKALLDEINEFYAKNS